MSDVARTHLLLKVGEILQMHLDGISDIKLMGDAILCSTEDRIGGVVIEIRIKELARDDFQEAETLVDPSSFGRNQ
jgi:hypothetical protein